jgi:flagellar biosynthesis component FlhA
MIEHVYPKFEPKWPVKFSIEVKSNQQAEVLVGAFIRLERYLRRGILRGDFKHADLADGLRGARRKLQKEAGLVLPQVEIDQLATKAIGRIAELKSANVKASPLSR